MLLAVRFHSSRIFFCLCVLFLAEGAIGLFGGETVLLSTTVHALAVLVPFNFVFIACMQERGFAAEATMPVAVLLFVQCISVAALCRAAESQMSSAAHVPHLVPSISVPEYGWLLLAATAVFLIVRFVMTGKPLEIAMLWSLLAFYLSLQAVGNSRLATLYSATAACILAMAIIENSYLLAYHDELTSLPSRRAFKDALLRLQEPYTIAVVDIDHFKRFNDTYGHDTGDQVLRLVALNLARVSGGGRAYRCGGEEFTILFPGKSVPEVVEPLEQLRESIEGSEFRMRGGDRRQAPRGPERRNSTTRRRNSKAQAIRDLSRERNAESLSVTVSIGVASSTRRRSQPDAVTQAADKALYRAKANGRNRVETASAKRRSSAKAAGIA